MLTSANDVIVRGSGFWVIWNISYRAIIGGREWALWHQHGTRGAHAQSASRILVRHHGTPYPDHGGTTAFTHSESYTTLLDGDLCATCVVDSTKWFIWINVNGAYKWVRDSDSTCIRVRRSFDGGAHSTIGPFTPKFKTSILPTFKREMYKWCSKN